MDLPPLEITPEPSDEERRAIAAALVAEDAERGSEPAWPRALLPLRADLPDEPPA